MRAIVVNNYGGPEVLTLTELDQPEPADDQVLVQLAASGINFLDVYQRNGALGLATPFAAGVEGVGTITAVGGAVSDLRVGERVGWFTGGQGSFGDYATVTAAKAVPIPDDVSDEIALAVLMQGVTAHYLATDTYPIRPGDHVLVHAAAGGVGQMLTQVAKIRGAVVIGTASTDEKLDTARAMGADHVAHYDDAADVVRSVTSGNGVQAAYDGIGKTTFETSLACLGIRGTFVIYGTASGPTPPLDIPRLNSGGSLFVTRPTIVHHTRTADELRRRTDDLFGWLARGDLKVSIGDRYPVAEVAEAFAAFEGRRTQGKIVLTH